MVTLDLSTRTALVTGGGRGLGREISLLLGEAGANVVVNYVRHQKPAEETVALLRDGGAASIALQADVSHPEDGKRLLDSAADRFGGVHILVANAALTAFRDLPEITRRQAVRTFEIGAWSLLALSVPLFPFFASEGYGRVIGISSVAGLRAAPGYAGIAMAKGALEAATRYLAEYAGRELENVTANTVVPSGFHDGTPEHVPYALLSEHMRREEARTPGGRAPTMREVAAAVLFLASDLASGVNGHALTVDRGWSLA